MTRRRTLLCVHPHPDDEAIACGGILARASAQGVRTVVVTCTGGEEGENLAGIDLGDEDLVTHRRRELADALSALGVGEHRWLGYRDSGMLGTASNDHPDSFHRADVEEAAARLATILRQVRPDVVVSDDERGTYGHPDHVKAHLVSVRAVALAAEPGADVPGEPWSVPKRYVHTLSRRRLLLAHQAMLDHGLASPFGTEPLASEDALPFGTPEEQVTTRIEVGPWLPAKRAALAAHRSQIGADSYFLNTPDELAERFFGTEEFVLEQGPLTRTGGGREDDLFAGLDERMAAGVSASSPSAAAGTPGGADTVGPDRFRDVLGRFVAGVTVMTTVTDDGEPHAMTASSITSVSLEPPLVLACVDRAAAMADLVTASGRFALSFLAADQAELSARFADPERPLGAEQLEEVPLRVGVSGSPVLEGCHGFVDCRLWQVHDGGDHLIVVGEVLDLGEGAEEPLAYHRGRYGRFVPDV